MELNAIDICVDLQTQLMLTYHIAAAGAARQQLAPGPRSEQAGLAAQNCAQ
jgi:hypothetical protein